MIEHYEIGWAERTGYPSWMQEDEDDQDAYEAYCDAIYDAKRDLELFGD
jgi:hypothetical protein